MARTTTPRRKRRRVTDDMKNKAAENKAVANALLENYAALLLADPGELDLFCAMAASIGVKHDPASDEPGYSLQNALLLAAQRRPISHCGSYQYWLTQGRCVKSGEKGMVTFRRAGRKKEDGEEDKKASEKGEITIAPKARWFVKGGTFDARQTRPIETCLFCGTTPASADDTTTECPATCDVFALRSGPAVDPGAALTLAEEIVAAGEDEDDL
ncbi:ArdC family protein [Nonomuraea longicatena]|uniref:N-terminal domain-containing protein n=1 Tax=Nonomuraea longicatena TaxID=83682 RepID=A0ABN1NY23_9ACTN